MVYIHIYDRLTRERIAILERAYNVSYELRLNELSSASFTLAADDPKTAYCRPLNYAEIWDDDERVELFRILPSAQTKTSETREIVYTCEHVLATLIDDLLWQYHELGGEDVTTPMVLETVLAAQSEKRWQLGDCAYSLRYCYAIESSSLLAALNSIAEPIPDGWMWSYDTTGYPWTLNLVTRPSAQTAELRYGKNLTGIRKTVDPTNLTTRLYPLGYGEGTNQLTIASVNGGTPYIDSDSIQTYGIVARTFVDTGIQDADILLETARQALAACDTPYISYEVDAAAVGRLLSPGDMARIIDDEDGTDTLLPVTAVAKSGLGADCSIVYTIANREEDVADSIADVANRQRIAELYSQGSTNTDSIVYADNASADKPLVVKLYVSKQAVRINAVQLTFDLSAFRGYTKGTESGGGSTTTSASGGGSSSSTESGGGSTQTSSSGGSTTVSGGKATTSGASLPANSAYLGSTKAATPTTSSMTHSHAIHLDAIRNHWHSVDFSHSHYIGSHSHTVTIPAHSHSFSISSHTHSVTIPAHRHGVEYGIFTGTRASSVTVEVDGTTVGTYSSGAELDIADYLSVDDEGRIRRGTWHTIELIPDKLTRISAYVQQTLFINPRQGADL